MQVKGKMIRKVKCTCISYVCALAYAYLSFLILLWCYYAYSWNVILLLLLGHELCQVFAKI